MWTQRCSVVTGLLFSDLQCFWPGGAPSGPPAVPEDRTGYHERTVSEMAQPGPDPKPSLRHRRLPLDMTAQVKMDGRPVVAGPPIGAQSSEPNRRSNAPAGP